GQKSAPITLRSLSSQHRPSGPKHSLNPLKTRISRPDCPAEAALGQDSRDLNAAGRGKARGGLVIAAGPGWEGFGGGSRAAEAAPGSRGWDGAEARRAPEDTQLTEPRGARLSSPPAARAARPPGSHSSQPGRGGAARARCALSVLANSPAARAGFGTKHHGTMVCKTLFALFIVTAGSIAAITVTVIAVVLLVFGVAAYLKIRHSSYGRLLDDHDYGSWGNYNNPLYDDS
uniref:Prostate androgen-regulated mucin-like protein 1 n=3 Tax=Suina TaxID=35497 RepID=A0A4X1T1D5_PIG